MKKNLFLTAFLLICVLFARSQDKYEFAIIEYSTYDAKLSISKNGKEFGIEKVEVGTSDFDATPLLKKVLEFQEKNWEIMSFNTVLAGTKLNRNVEIYFAYLRRKKTS